ncbi:hypothetical protein SAMN04487941_2177 [Pontibacter akesuensis]|uniref:Uncharacterized protein n=1 Tax=Pontibacter akesuensis TaxID=388950 RepID=A0A1I7IFL8_9BACT|nr:hypothetical protein SAMN04487941_2177 [Pontibacter akesuensis]
MLAKDFSSDLSLQTKVDVFDKAFRWLFKSRVYLLLINLLQILTKLLSSVSFISLYNWIIAINFSWYQ